MWVSSILSLGKFIFNRLSDNVGVPFAKRDQQDLLERWMLCQKGIALARRDLASSL
jgi:hypothetical protein